MTIFDIDYSQDNSRQLQLNLNFKLFIKSRNSNIVIVPNDTPQAHDVIVKGSNLKQSISTILTLSHKYDLGKLIKTTLKPIGTYFDNKVANKMECFTKISINDIYPFARI